MIVWVIWERGDDRFPRPRKVVLTTGRDREEAKRNAKPFLLTDPDEYIVEPVISSQDELIIALKLQGEK